MSIHMQQQHQQKSPNWKQWECDREENSAERPTINEKEKEKDNGITVSLCFSAVRWSWSIEWFEERYLCSWRDLSHRNEWHHWRCSVSRSADEKVDCQYAIPLRGDPREDKPSTGDKEKKNRTSIDQTREEYRGEFVDQKRDERERESEGKTDVIVFIDLKMTEINVDSVENSNFHPSDVRETNDSVCILRLVSPTPKTMDRRGKTATSVFFLSLSGFSSATNRSRQDIRLYLLCSCCVTPNIPRR